MRLSRYFLPILKENPREAEIVSHRLMLRAGMIRQQAAGSFSWLPLGKRVLDKVCRIVREEQDRAGALEILMPTIQSAELWRESGRYDDYGKEMLRIKDRQERDMLYGPTNEEMVTEIFRAYVKSYKDLPLNLYHIQWKFRDEVRPRFGVMRSREFLMKDAYSFDLDFEGAKAAYNRMFVVLSAHLHAHGPARRSRCAPTPGRSAATSATNSSSWPTPARARCSATATISSLPVPGADTDFADDARDRRHRRSNGRRPMPRPTRCTTRQPWAQDRRRRAAVGARHRGRPYLPFRRQIFQADGRQGDRPRRQGSFRLDGLLRHRPDAG